MITALLVYMKRQLKGGFLFMLLCMPLLAVGVKYFIPQQSLSPTAAFFTQGSDSLSTELAEQLLNHNGYVKFLQTDSYEELERLVENRSVECGYVIPEDLEERVESLNLKNAIICGENPSTILSDIIDEIVFSKLIYCCGGSVANNYAQSQNINTNSDEINTFYKDYINSDDVFSLVFEQVQAPVSAAAKSSQSSVVRGIIAVYIMLGGLLGTIPWYKDEERKIYLYGSGNVIASVVLMCIFGLISLYISGDWTDIREIVLMALYGLCICGYCCLLKMIFQNQTVMCGVYPIITLGALCFCPVVFDISLLSKSLGMAGRIFMPYYYIDYVNGGSIYGLLIAGVICWVLYFAIKTVIRR